MIGLSEYLARLISPEPNSGCWLWLGAPVSHGYGQVKRGNVRVGAHIAVYEEVRGPVPEGLELDHLCRVSCCVNPDHLDPVTHQENCRRGLVGQNMRSKTHCPQGHPYFGDNLYLHKGRRHCWTCITKRKRARHKIRRIEDPEYRKKSNASKNRAYYRRRDVKIAVQQAQEGACTKKA